MGKTCNTCMWCGAEWVCRSPDSPMQGVELKPGYSCDHWKSDLEGPKE